MEKKIISFDWDGTLADSYFVQQFFIHMYSTNTCIIVTSRNSEDKNEDIHEFLKNFPNSRVYYTNGNLKWPTLLELGVSLHLDNDDLEVYSANSHNIEAWLINPYLEDNRFINFHMTSHLKEVWAFEYCSNTWESGPSTMSLHTSESKAREAMEKHIEECKVKYKESLDPQDSAWPYVSFGEYENWGVRQIKILP